MKTLSIALLTLTFILVGCGKGGGKGDSGGNSSVTITEKGERNILMKEGDGMSLFIELDSFSTARLTGKQINSSDVVYENPSPNTGVFARGDVQTIKFIKIKGPELDTASAVKLWSEYKKFGLLFTAPETKGAESVEYEYKIIMINDKGSSDETFRKITVTGINDTPTIKLAASVETQPAQPVTLNAAESFDIDGKITTFGWKQLSGPSVTLTDTNQATLSFSAPNTAKLEEIVLQLTATDNAGATSTQKVSVWVVPQDLPSVYIRFPAPTGVTSAKSISISGSATGENEASITKVDVKVGSATYAAKLYGSYWEVLDAPVPATGESFEILVSAEDNLGKIGQARSVINKSGSIVSDITWKKILGLDVNPINGELLAFVEAGGLFYDYSVAAIKLNSNDIDTIAYTFDIPPSTTKNPEFSGNISTAFYLTDHTYYIGASNTSITNPTSKIHAVDLSAGTASQIYPTATNQDIALKSISGIFKDPEERLFVADGGHNKLFELDLGSGTIKPFTNQLFPSEEVNYIALAFDPFYNNYSPYMIPNIPRMPILAGNIANKTIDVIAGPFATSEYPAKKLVVDEALRSAYVLDVNGDVYFVDLENKTRSLYASGPIGEIAYNAIDSILYLYFTKTKSISMVDVFKGESVEVTRSK